MKTPAQKAEHLRKAKHYARLKQKAAKLWGAVVDREHRRIFGQPFAVQDYQISGIARNEYADKVKTRLRALTAKINQYADAAYNHWKAAGKRLPVSTLYSNPARRAKNAETAIYGRQNKNGGVWYVQNLPGDGGVDWGYTNDYKKALPLNKYWARRFLKNLRDVGAVPHLSFAHAEFKQNPARRAKIRSAKKRTVKRAGLSLSSYVRRPSQITRKSPSKRLVRRRVKRVAKPVKGFFPNPAVLRWPANTPRGYYGVFPARGGVAVYTTRDELIASRQAHLYADTHKARYIVARKK